MHHNSFASYFKNIRIQTMRDSAFERQTHHALEMREIHLLRVILWLFKIIEKCTYAQTIYHRLFAAQAEQVQFFKGLVPSPSFLITEDSVRET